MMNEVSIDVSCSYQTNYVVEIATNVIAEDQSVDLDEHDGEFQFGIMVRTIYSIASSVSKKNSAWRTRNRSIQCW